MLIERLVLTGYTPAPPRKEISKTALGAEQVVPWEHYSDRQEGIERLRDDGYAIWGVELTDDAVPLDRIREIGIPERVALLFGNELRGLLPETLALCDRVVMIPMSGVKHSYNIAVSFGVVMWEVTKGNSP
jgi:tRNA G18 (ribose-2'-O)-methylase SpoU